MGNGSEPVVSGTSKRALSVESSPFKSGLLGSSHRSASDALPVKQLSLDVRSASTPSLTRGFLAQFRQGSKTKESFGGDELGYLEGKSSTEGPPSQRIYSRIYWKVVSSLA
jgi:hypothetical protein